MDSLFRNVDCIELYVDDIDDGISYYCDSLGLKLLWRNETTAGLGMDNDITEVVINCERKGIMVDMKVDSVVETIPRILAAGGSVAVDTFDIPIGKCAVVCDKWGNRYVILDMTKGRYVTDDNGNIVGLEPEVK